jgi:hypothetical protein
MLAAQLMQARAQQAQNQRIASGGTPMPQPGTNMTSPYQIAPELADMMPNGIDGGQQMHIQTSPAAMVNNGGMHSSPQSQHQQQARVASMPMASTPHLRPQGSNSPQMGNVTPQQTSQVSQALMGQIVAQITASGMTPTTELVKHHIAQYMRNVSLRREAKFADLFLLTA